MGSATQYHCPSCQQSFTAPEGSRGSIPCPHCGRSVMLIDFGERTDAQPAAGRPQEPELEPTPLSRSRSNFVPYLLAALGALGVLLMFAFIVFMFWLPFHLQSDQSWSKTSEDISVLATLLEIYRMDVGEFPTDQQGLAALCECPSSLAKPDRWKGPYTDSVEVDEWGQELGTSSCRQTDL